MLYSRTFPTQHFGDKFETKNKNAHQWKYFKVNYHYETTWRPVFSNINSLFDLILKC